MNMAKLSHTSSAAVLGLALLAGMAACNKASTSSGQTAANNTTGAAPPLAALPLATGDTPVTPAPTGAALPPAPRVRIARLQQPEDSYAYLDRAYAMSHAFGDAPPDYTVDYGGGRPWIWRGQDNSYRVAEQLPSGMRYYYYEPGADEPYLVQDPEYAYAYSNGQLVSVYGRDGSLLPYEEEARRSDLAGRYLARSRALYVAAQHQDRLAVQQAHWNERRAEVAAEQAQWAQQQSQQSAWAAYHQAHAQEEDAHWADERHSREAYAARYDQGQNDVAGAAAALAAAAVARSVAQHHSQGPGPRPGPSGAEHGGRPGESAGAGAFAQGPNDHRGAPDAEPPTQHRAQAEAASAQAHGVEAQQRAALAARQHAAQQAQAARQAEATQQHAVEAIRQAQSQAHAAEAAQRQAQAQASAHAAQAQQRAAMEAEHQTQARAAAHPQAAQHEEAVHTHGGPPPGERGGAHDDHRPHGPNPAP